MASPSQGGDVAPLESTGWRSLDVPVNGILQRPLRASLTRWSDYYAESGPRRAYFSAPAWVRSTVAGAWRRGRSSARTTCFKMIGMCPIQ
jgi:hypothetical protein